MADEIVELGAGNLQRRTTQNKNGTQRNRYTTEISGDTLLVNTDPKSIGQGVAQAIADHFRERIKNITATASSATVAFRKRAAKSLAEGASWATKRYSGGKMGAMQPAQGDRLFNDSGRLAASIKLGATKDESWVVNVAANRFDPKTLDGGERGLLQVFTRLQQYIPELVDLRLLKDVLSIKRAINQSLADMHVKAADRGVEAARQLLQARMQVANAFLSMVG